MRRKKRDSEKEAELDLRRVKKWQRYAEQKGAVRPGGAPVEGGHAPPYYCGCGHKLTNIGGKWVCRDCGYKGWRLPPGYRPMKPPEPDFGSSSKDTPPRLIPAPREGKRPLSWQKRIAEDLLSITGQRWDQRKPRGEARGVRKRRRRKVR